MLFVNLRTAGELKDDVNFVRSQRSDGRQLLLFVIDGGVFARPGAVVGGFAIDNGVIIVARTGAVNPMPRQMYARPVGQSAE